MLTSTADIDILIRKLKYRYDLEGAEMVGTTGIDYLEGLVHELGHVLDFGHTIGEAMGVIGSHRDVAKLVAKFRTPRGQDGNEIRATAITVVALSGFPGYTAVNSTANMYSNTLTDDAVAIQTRYERAVKTARSQRLGKRVREFLLAEFQLQDTEPGLHEYDL